MDIYQLCKDEMGIDATQFYNSAIVAVASLIAGQLLLFFTYILLLHRTAASAGTSVAERRAFMKSSLFVKINVICLHGIMTSKGYFSVEQFRQVFLLTLAPAR